MKVILEVVCFLGVFEVVVMRVKRVGFGCGGFGVSWKVWERFRF